MFYCSWATEGNQTYRRFVINKRIYNSPTGKVYGVKMNPDPLYTWGKLSLTCFRITEIKKSRPVFSLSLTLQANQLFGLFLPVKILNRLLSWSVIYLGWFLPGTLSDMHNFTFIMWRTWCHAKKTTVSHRGSCCLWTFQRKSKMYWWKDELGFKLKEQFNQKLELASE